SKTSDPKPSPSREPSPKPSASQVPQPTPKPTPRRARTPLELARVRLAPKQETEASGADDLVSKNGEKEQATLVLELMQGLIPAMAIGDLDLAERELKELTSNPDFQLGAFKDEVEHDLETLRDLRELAGLSLQELTRSPRRLGIYGGEQIDLSEDLRVLNKSGYLRAQLREDYWLELDPCALKLRDLRDIVVSRDKEVDNASAHYGLAVLGIYRGLSERDLDEDLTEALRTNDKQIEVGRNAVKRRRRLAEFLSQAMVKSWRAFEDEAGNRWRKEEKLARKPKRHVDALEKFVEEFGRTATYLRRREDWLRFMSQHLELSDLLKGKGRSGGREVRYRFKEGEPTDFVLRPLEDEGDQP
ncbi:MAG TPA: hypothetical protein DEA08_35715, partial [Planctomycetes bacterium]|nr:hypothetical protein [Planctomycetota bacterium]